MILNPQPPLNQVGTVRRTVLLHTLAASQLSTLNSQLSLMHPDIWMPTFIGEYTQETLHLNRADHGSYQLLRMAYWTNGGPLPDDDESLRTICKCSPEEWPRTKGLLSKFFTVGGGVWAHQHLDAELKKATSLSSLRKKLGSDGAARRWQKNGNCHAGANGRANGLANGRAMAGAGEPDSATTATFAAQPIPEGSSTPENGKTMAKPMANGMAKPLANGCLLPSPLPVQVLVNRRIVDPLPEIPPMTRQAYESMAEMRGIPRECYEWFWNTCEGTGWLDFRGRPIRKVEPLLLNLFVKWRQNDFKRRRAEGASRPMTDAELLRHAQG